jgi:hypothetical protein
VSYCDRGLLGSWISSYSIHFEDFIFNVMYVFNDNKILFYYIGRDIVRSTGNSGNNGKTTDRCINYLLFTTNHSSRTIVVKMAHIVLIGLIYYSL